MLTASEVALIVAGLPCWGLAPRSSKSVSPTGETLGGDGPNGRWSVSLHKTAMKRAEQSG